MNIRPALIILSLITLLILALNQGTQSVSTCRYPNETEANYLCRMTNLVHKNIKFNQEPYTVPVYENYILWLRGALGEPYYRHYEYSDWRGAFKHGKGICSQFASALLDILHENNINATIIGLGGHTVVSTNCCTLDPTLNVIIPSPIHILENNPELIRPYYKSLYPELNLSANKLVEMYNKTHNYRKATLQEYYEHYHFDTTSWLTIFLIPIFILFVIYSTSRVLF